jgi:hypothetical protein
MISDLGEMYLETVKRALTGLDHEASYELRPGLFERGVTPRLDEALGSLVKLAGRLSRQRLVLVREIGRTDRLSGGPWPLVGETMVGAERLDHLRGCIVQVLDDGVPGDLIETGVWRGGAAIFMRAVLAAAEVRDRSVWVADSFTGVPQPDPSRHPADAGYDLHRHPELAVSLTRVRAAFERYGLLDNQVRFVEGRFADTLPALRGHPWALLRLDGDLAESTHDALVNLYPSLAPGGFVIVDDYGVVRACRSAVDAFRREHGIQDPIEWIDGSAVFWRRGAPGG